MAKIIAPNKQYTGISAGVPFAAGMGETDDERLIEWFKDHGYEVEGMVEQEPAAGEQSAQDQKELKDMSVEELTAYAQEKGIDLGQATTPAGMIKKIQEAEKKE